MFHISLGYLEKYLFLQPWFFCGRALRAARFRRNFARRSGFFVRQVFLRKSNTLYYTSETAFCQE